MAKVIGQMIVQMTDDGQMIVQGIPDDPTVGMNVVADIAKAVIGFYLSRVGIAEKSRILLSDEGRVN